MRLLRVIPSMNPSTGGPCQGIRNAIPELQKLGIYNEVACLDDPRSSFSRNDLFPVHLLGPAKGPWQYSNKLVPWLEKNVHRFDAVIVHGLWLYHDYAVVKFFRQLRARTNNKKSPKLFVMPHGMLDPYFQKAPGRKLKAIRNKIYWKLVESKVIENADAMLFTTESELLLAREAFQPYLPKQEINIGYGIAAPPPFTHEMHNAFINECSGLNDRPFILFLSRIHEKKSVDLLIQSYVDIVKGSNTANQTNIPKLVIVGPGMNTPFGKNLLTMAADLKDEYIFFPGMLTGDAKWGAFYNCDAFILPSHQENFGIAVAEAMACSKPVLISNQVNIFREIETSHSGIVADDTVEGVSYLLNSFFSLTDVEKKQMGVNAKTTYEKYFAAAPAAQKMLSILSN
ncbi:glycosyltransferase [Panacibacter sp. DH6]|uniref:Glycosyltransferase n=1 Tax=Panacibacter microcysteis TaxID=2793269 RepID=A0A931GW16_9BACT|nr:glycosyltransferase [Panacibacter microcysteis]MBG9377065.1 glycosyltransferase [Panacibacter microcysteis]